MRFTYTFLIPLVLLLALPAALAAASRLTCPPNGRECYHRHHHRGADVDAQTAAIVYSGPWSSFPKMDSWVGLDTLVKINMAQIRATGSTARDAEGIVAAVREASSGMGVDERVIFAIIMQESHGDVGVRSTVDAGAGRNAGLMQSRGCESHEGEHNLPQTAINNMVACGTNHFLLGLNDFGGQGAGERAIYPALRRYNSYTVNEGDLSAPAPGSTPKYVSDVARRLTGEVF